MAPASSTIAAGEDAACSYRSVLNSVAAGYAAGVCGVIVGHPMDSAKVWLQTNSRGILSSPAKESGKAVSSSSAVTGLRHGTLPKAGQNVKMSTLATIGSQQSSPHKMLTSYIRTLRALYSGVGVPLVTVGMVSSINFAIFDSVRRVLHKRGHPLAQESDYLYQDSLPNVAAAACCSGTVLAVITSPLIFIKTKQQLQGIGFRKALLETLRPNGGQRVMWSGCFVGFGAHFLMETFGRVVYFSTYEALKRGIMLRRQRQQKNSASPPASLLTVQDRMLSAGLAGVVCWAVIFPVDVVRSRAYAQAHEGKTSLQIAISTFHENGGSVRAFYRGFFVTVIRAGPVAAGILPLYDFVLERLSTP